MGNKKLNILIVHNYYQISGGEDTVVKNEMEMLKQHGHKVILYSRNNSEINSMSVIQKAKLPFTAIFSLKTFTEIKEIIRSQNIDIIHVHNTLSLISYSVYYAAIHCKIPIIQTIHNFRILCPGATFYRDGHICEECTNKGLYCSLKYKCYRNNELQTLVCVINMLIHRLTGIYRKLNYICLTDFNKNKLIGLNQIKSSKVYVKPNFARSSGKIVPFEKRKEQFIFVGRLDKIKGLELLFNTWILMGKDAPKLLICGTGVLEEWCIKFIKDNDLNSVEMLGFLPNDRIINIIGESKALILPTQWYEGFPMTIVEAYSVGTPVIGSDLGNVGALIEDGVTGFKFHYDSVIQLQDAVNRMRNCDLVKETVERYVNYYSEVENYRQLMRLYKSVMEG